MRQSARKSALIAAALAAPLAAAMAPAPADAASFDCTRARAADERAICASRSLSDKDVEMATMFRLIPRLQAIGERGNLQDAQVAWLRTRRACGGDRACLTRAYDLRIAQLQRAFDAIASRGPF